MRRQESSDILDIRETLDKADMDETEARYYLRQLKKTGQEFYFLLYELKQRKGWKALGYASWMHFVNRELGLSKQGAAGAIRQACVTLELGENEIIPAAQSLILSKLPSTKIRKEVWEQAFRNGKKPTPSSLQETVLAQGLVPVSIHSDYFCEAELIAIEPFSEKILVKAMYGGKRIKIRINRADLEAVLRQDAMSNAEPLTERECPICGTVFKIQSEGHIYCSGRCSSAMKNRKMRERKSNEKAIR